MAFLAGRARTRITIEREIEVHTGSGGTRRHWQEVVTLWAEKLPARGREAFEQAAQAAQQVVRFRTRYRAGINEGMRVSEGGRAHNITSVVDPGDRHRELEIWTQLEQKTA